MCGESKRCFCLGGRPPSGERPPNSRGSAHLLAADHGVHAWNSTPAWYDLLQPVQVECVHHPPIDHVPPTGVLRSITVGSSSRPVRTWPPVAEEPISARPLRDPSTRFGTTGPDWLVQNRISLLTVPEVRYNWIPRA